MFWVKDDKNQTIKLEAVEKEIFDVLTQRKQTRADQSEVGKLLLATSLSDEKKSWLERRLQLLDDEADDLKRALAILERRRDAIIKGIALPKAALLAFRPMETLVRVFGRYNERAAPRLPASVLAPKPGYNPAQSDPVDLIDRTYLTVSSWCYLVRGVVPPRLRSPLGKESYTADEAGYQAAAAVPGVASCETSTASVMGVAWGHDVAAPLPAEAVAEVSASTKDDTRTIGVVMSTSGCGKTHLAADVWYARDKLDQPQYVKVARAAGITDAAWSVIAQQAKDMSVCCVNFNGLTAWCELDQEMVTSSAWYKEVYLTNPRRQQTDRADGAGAGRGGADAAGSDRGGADGAAADVAGEDVDGASTVGADAAGTDRGGAGGVVADAAASDVTGAVGDDAVVYKDSHLLPLYLRVLWCLMYQAAMPFGDFVFEAWARVCLGELTVASIIAEARSAVRQGRVAILVDELTMATMDAGDRRLCELYRHIICTFTGGAFVSALFFSLSFLFILEEITPKQVSSALTAAGGMPPSVKMWTPGNMGDGSPWSLVAIGTLTPPSYAELFEKLLPVVQSRTVTVARSVAGVHTADPVAVADALVRVSGGHLRCFSYLRREIRSCLPGSTLWDVVTQACQATGLTSSVFNLLLQTVCFPVLLVAGFCRCTINGRAILMPAPGFVPGDGYCVLWDDAFTSNLLCGSSNAVGLYKNPSHLTAFLLALSSKWHIVAASLKAKKQKVQPEVASIMAAFDRFVSSARIADAGRAWEVSTYWSEVLLSRLRHAASLYLVEAPGVDDATDYSRIALLDLYKGVDNLEQQPSTRALLSEVLVDATRPLEAEDVLADLIVRHSTMEDVLKLPTTELISKVFMMSSSHLSFDLVRFLPVVHDARPVSSPSSATGGVVAICISCKSTSNVEVTLPIKSKVVKPQQLMADAFGDQWSKWKDHVVHVTICNFRRTDDPKVFLADDAVAEHTIVVCREQFEAMYGKCMGELLSSAHVLHGSTIVL